MQKITGKSSPRSAVYFIYIKKMPIDEKLTNERTDSRVVHKAVTQDWCPNYSPDRDPPSLPYASRKMDNIFPCQNYKHEDSNPDTLSDCYRCVNRDSTFESKPENWTPKEGQGYISYFSDSIPKQENFKFE